MMVHKSTIQTRNVLKIFLGLTLAVVIVFCLQTTAFAASQPNQGTVVTTNTPLNVTPSDNEGYPSPDTNAVLPEPVWVWHPICVVNEPMNGFNAVRRTYALPPDVNPAVISTANFEMFGQRFTFAYVIQQTTTDESFVEMRETVTIEAQP